MVTLYVSAVWHVEDMRPAWVCMEPFIPGIHSEEQFACSLGHGEALHAGGERAVDFDSFSFLRQRLTW